MSASSSPAGTDSAVVIEEPLSYIEQLKRLPKVPFWGKEEKRAIYKRALEHCLLVVKECLSLYYAYGQQNRLEAPCGYVTKGGYFISTNPQFNVEVSLESGWSWDRKERTFMRPADWDLFGLWWITHKSGTRQNAVRELEEFLSGDMEKLEQEQAQRELEWSHQLKDLIYPALLTEGRSRRRGSCSQLRKLVEAHYGEEFPKSDFRRCLQDWVASADPYRFTVTCLTRKNNNHTFTLVNNFDICLN